MENNKINIFKEIILKIFFFLEENYYYTHSCVDKNDKIFDESLDIEYLEKTKRRKIVISYTKTKILEKCKYTFSIVIIRMPYSGEEDIFSLDNYLQFINEDFSSTFTGDFEIKTVEKILNQLKKSLIKNALEIIEGKIWLETFYPRRD